MLVLVFKRTNYLQSLLEENIFVMKTCLCISTGNFSTKITFTKNKYFFRVDK
jgi:hypothetical protein